MKKYLMFFKISFENFLEYRTNLALGFLLKLIVFTSFVFIWTQIANEGKTIYGYGLSGIIFYYLCTQVLDGLYTSQAAKLLRDSILKGNLSNNLIKPFCKPLYFMFIHFSRIITETLVHIILTIPIILFNINILNNIVLNTNTIIQFSISAFLSAIFGFNLYFAIGLISFWTTQAYGLQMVVKNASRFFTGDLMPLDLISYSFRKYIMLTPFPYTLYFPIKALMGGFPVSDFLYSMKIILFWIILLIIVNYFLWKKGLKQYEAVGI